MKRTNDDEVESNKRARVESKDRGDGSVHISINQSTRLSKLIEYPFLLPLVTKFLSIDSVLSLLLVCKDVCLFVNDFPVKKLLNQEEANKLIDPSRYVTFRVTCINKAKSPDLSMHPLLDTLHFDDEFNTSIEPGHLPPKLTWLMLNDKFNHYMKPGTIPSTIHYLELPKYWDQSFELGLFSEIETLNFKYAFNHPLEPGCFSSKLTSLDLGVKFDHTLRAGVLPSTLRDLTMSRSFDQPLLPDVLPVGLKKLNLGVRFDQPIGRGVLPDSLETLQFSMLYDHPIQPGDLPSSLTSLSFGELFSQPITVGVVPASVVTLSFSCAYQQFIPPGAIPSNVKSLVLGFNDLPLCLEPGSIPSTITSLDLGYHFEHIPDADAHNEAAELDIPADVIPTTIESLTLHQLPCTGTIPDHITKIEFGRQFNHSIPVGIIPDSIKTLVFGGRFNRPIIVGSIPSSVERLNFGFAFNQRLSSGMIPNSVTHLSLLGFNQPITKNSLPDSVKFLCFPMSFSASSLVAIPRNVTHLTLGQVTAEELVQRLFPLVLASQVTHLSLRLKSDSRCFVRCEDGFMQHEVDDYLKLANSSSWPPAPTSKTKLLRKILFSEIETRSLSADRFD